MLLRQEFASLCRQLVGQVAAVCKVHHDEPTSVCSDQNCNQIISNTGGVYFYLIKITSECAAMIAMISIVRNTNSQASSKSLIMPCAIPRHSTDTTTHCNGVQPGASFNAVTLTLDLTLSMTHAASTYSLAPRSKLSTKDIMFGCRISRSTEHSRRDSCFSRADIFAMLTSLITYLTLSALDSTNSA